MLATGQLERFDNVSIWSQAGALEDLAEQADGGFARALSFRPVISATETLREHFSSTQKKAGHRSGLFEDSF